jgi:hypothetical protein
LFNVFIDIIGYIIKSNLNAPTLGKETVPGLLFAHDLAVSSFTIKGLQKAINRVVKYCRDWNLRCNIRKSEISVF